MFSKDGVMLIAVFFGDELKRTGFQKIIGVVCYTLVRTYALSLSPGWKATFQAASVQCQIAVSDRRMMCL